MKPAPFDYHRATSVADAVEVLAATQGDGKLIAGGQSLVPLLSMRMAQPTVLIDLNGLDELATAPASSAMPSTESRDSTDSGDSTGSRDRPSPDRVSFGAMVRHRDLCLQVAHPLAAEMAGWIAHTAIRSRGTLGGSLAHADPNAECPALALACDGLINVNGPTGERRIEATGLFEGMLQTTMADDEILTTVELEVPRRWGFAELARRHGDFAFVLAVVTELGDGWRVVIGGVGSTPIRLPDAEAALASGFEAAEVGRLVEAGVVAYDDVHGGAAYRRAMAGALVRQACDQALSSAASTPEAGPVRPAS